MYWMILRVCVCTASFRRTCKPTYLFAVLVRACQSWSQIEWMWPCKNSNLLLLLGVTDQTFVIVANFCPCFFWPGQDVGRDRQHFALCHAHDEGTVSRDDHHYDRILILYTTLLVEMLCRLCRVVLQYLAKLRSKPFRYWMVTLQPVEILCIYNIYWV